MSYDPEDDDPYGLDESNLRSECDTEGCGADWDLRLCDHPECFDHYCWDCRREGKMFECAVCARVLCLKHRVVRVDETLCCDCAASAPPCDNAFEGVGALVWTLVLIAVWGVALLLWKM